MCVIGDYPHGGVTGVVTQPPVGLSRLHWLGAWAPSPTSDRPEICVHIHVLTQFAECNSCLHPSAWEFGARAEGLAGPTEGFFVHIHMFTQFAECNSCLHPRAREFGASAEGVAGPTDGVARAM